MGNLRYSTVSKTKQNSVEPGSFLGALTSASSEGKLGRCRKLLAPSAQFVYKKFHILTPSPDPDPIKSDGRQCYSMSIYLKAARRKPKFGALETLAKTEIRILYLLASFWLLIMKNEQSEKVWFECAISDFLGS